MTEESSSQQNSAGSTQESTPFAAPQISLPKGGGAIRGIGEKFTANAATGTGSLIVPIALSAGRSGFGPQLSLSYDSGSGNGAFGIGWNLSLPSITRKTDKGLPQYRDDQESDVFILSGAEDLVPVLKKDGATCWADEEFEREGYRIKRYRPRVEGLFARIERWTRLEDGATHWRSISKDNILTIYGRTAESRIADEHDPRHVFSWIICESYDDKGNGILYEYVAENDSGVDLTLPNEANRSRTANRYLKRIRYGNRKPLLLDVGLPSFRRSHLDIPGLATADWMFEAVLDYNDGHYRQEKPDHEGWVCAHATPAPEPGCSWPARKDPFSSYRSGFEVRTYRLCRRVLMFHHFPHELGTEDYLVRSTEFEYRQKAIGSFITRVIQSGYTRHPDGRYLRKSLPSLDLTYTSSPLEDRSFTEYRVREASPENLPGGIDGQNYKWLDLDGEGIPGVLTEQGDSWFYKPNAGGGRFRPLKLTATKPSLAALSQGKQQLLDIAGDGNLDLVQLGSSVPGFYERTLEEGWGSFRTFRSLPVCNWDDPNLKFVDITGDGIADVLITDDDAITWHHSLLSEGFGSAVRVAVPHDEREGPHVVFADGTQSVYLADMSGDGLSDIVRVRNGEICYWPNLGYGKFGRKVTMDHSPWFDDPDLFDQKRIKLTDTDGSGTTDLVYLGRDGIKVFLNQSGNGWSGARMLPAFAAANDQTSVSVIDFLGRGTACLLWSSILPADEERPLRYVDLMCGQKPHLLINICNNLGVETRIEYASSTEFYLADEAAGTPWITRLPFPVHVVKRVETYDHISRNRFVTSYSYHHGFFDGVEREFRGFGRVDQLDTEDFATLSKSSTFPVGENIKAESNVPPVLTKTWFHTGVYLGGGFVSRHLAREYWREPGLLPHEEQTMLLDDTILPDHLTPEEAREACRSLKGSTLRQEIYALDGREESARPYTVSESNFTIRLLQPRGRNRHAVFFTHAREALSFNYERKLFDIDGCRRADPRVTHNVNLEVDDYGNVLKSANVGYGRRFADPSLLLSDDDREKQKKILLTLTDNRYTNAVRDADAYRNPLLAEARLYELIHAVPAACEFGVTNLFRFHELAAKVAQASDGRHDLPYEDVNARGAATPASYRRILKESRMLYRSNALDRILPLGALEALALPGQNYKLAFTPGLLGEVYRRPRPDQPPENLLPDPATVLRDEGGYVDLDGNGYWWVPSGTVSYSRNTNDSPARELDNARHHFFLPVRFRDPFENVSTVGYDPHDLAAVDSRDPVGNTLHAVIDYRVLSPYLMTDANQNLSQVAFDALGMVVGTAIMGKKGQDQGDTLGEFVPDLAERTALEHTRHPLRDPWEILQGATTRLVYDLFAFERTRNQARPHPPVVYTLTRETHVADLQPGETTRVQHSFSYSDGFNREVQKKVQAEPGPLLDGGDRVDPRWIGSGWTIFNNKGKPVRQYEPFFSDTQEFEFAKMVGASPILIYDPVERVIATLHPDHTFEKVLFNPWQQETWDVNDSVLECNPAADPDIGGYLTNFPRDIYQPTWFEQRESGALGKAEQIAAQKASVHANTPATSYFDSLNRRYLSIAHNRLVREDMAIDEYFSTFTEFAIQGQQLSITDALKRKIISYVYNMIDAKIYQNSADAGQRWLLNDVTAKPIRSWDCREHEFHFKYDPLHRPIELLLKRTHGDLTLAERTVYGEDVPDAVARNLRARTYRQYDGAGVVTNAEYDFKGNLRTGKRQLLAEYRESEVNWFRTLDLESEVYATSTAYDALNRVLTSTLPDKTTIHPHYNPTSLLDRVEVQLGGSSPATSFVDAIGYNPKGQREFIAYSNGAQTRYQYDPVTFRLLNLKTTRTMQDIPLQDLTYTYDPVGNVTLIHDSAHEKVYFRNQVVGASNSYIYDAVYRLIEAEGREHIGQMSRPQIDYDDSSRMNQPLPGDGQAMRRYQERYRYDAVGNILEMIHSAVGGNWRRVYHYDEREPIPSNNRLTSTTIGELTERYAYDTCGNMTRMPHLHAMEWNFKNQLHATRAQFVDGGNGRKTVYIYDAAGQRVRKITEHGSGAKARERIYLGGFEIYREYSKHAGIKLERQSVHVTDDKRRLALVETKTTGSHPETAEMPSTLIRYQFSNHLDSSTLELDESAEIISYEEYYPYGSTSYESVGNQVEVSPKRYRYTGKERDDESGLYYHGARYCAEWIGRWTAPDPAGISSGTNLFQYCFDNPVRFNDLNGKDPTDDQKAFRQIFTERQQADASTAHAATLVQAFRDHRISGITVAERFQAILELTGGSTPGPVPHFDTFAIREIGTESSATGVGDTGFRTEMRDSLVDQGRAVANHRESSDQIGHFLTAAHIGFYVTDSENYLNTRAKEIAAFKAEHPIRAFFSVEESVNVEMRVNFNFDSNLYLSAMIGHEMVADRTFSGWGLTSTIAAPFMASSQDYSNFESKRLDLINIDDAKRGNSYQDLLLTWVGFRFGQDVANNKFGSKKEASRWLNMMLTPQDLNNVAQNDPFYGEAQELKGLLSQFKQIQQKTRSAAAAPAAP